ncbi:hypothetical protein HMPREF9444_01022 [Succinatimonas hippei YIT 12066]|uniref:Uncharacterized protein n=1 Tax=Succinatimonas hippei (strain DSM 22608 / JCM 16073 / KCTC 15190 / YIT 12066) TaxID=762983 RepID=E8LJY5_SUCHY|nr:hypothetical protein HMPREF9444_01022 [Succinatimonas hippei YIT 12066]
MKIYVTAKKSGIAQKFFNANSALTIYFLNPTRFILQNPFKFQTTIFYKKRIIAFRLNFLSHIFNRFFFVSKKF